MLRWGTKHPLFVEPAARDDNSSDTDVRLHTLYLPGNIMKSEGPSFRSSMSAREFVNQFNKFKNGIDTYAHDVNLDNGEFVVHLRKLTFLEKNGPNAAEDETGKSNAIAQHYQRRYPQDRCRQRSIAA